MYTTAYRPGGMEVSLYMPFIFRPSQFPVTDATLKILPDYLQDEEGISFPRNQAATFYRRITECMMKKMGGPSDGDDMQGETVEAAES